MDIIPTRSYIDVPEFHDRFPILGGAIVETLRATQAPNKMVTHCAVNAVFSAVQGLANFGRPDGGCSPLTNISLIIGETGERKSSVDACFFKGIYRFRSESKANHDAELEHRARMRLWNIERKILEKHATKALKDGHLANSHLVEALKQHDLRCPMKPSIVFLYQDTSMPSLKHGLSEYPVACVHSTEGMSILTGKLFEEQGLLCQLYSGETYLYDRMDKHLELEGVRLCVSAHSQPKRTLAFLEKMGDDYRDSGLAARMTLCLVTDSTQGHRFYDDIQTATTGRNRFEDRVHDLMTLTKGAVDSKLGRQTIHLSPSAKRFYLDMANSIEEQIRPHGRFFNTRDYANRLADKMGRLSAALHFFEGFEGDISMNTLVAAQGFHDVATDDFEYLFNHLPSDHHLADQLLKWLNGRRPRYGEIGIRQSDILNCCIPRLRHGPTLHRIIDLLERTHRVHVLEQRRTRFVCLGPDGFRPFIMGPSRWLPR